MPSTRLYSTKLLNSFDEYRAQLQNAWDAYDAQISEHGFPQWEVAVNAPSLESLPPSAANLLRVKDDEYIGALRAVGSIRRQCDTDGVPGSYACVVELSFRGTQDIGHWATNLSVELEPLALGPHSARVHRGFQQGYLAMRDCLHSTFEDHLSRWNEGAEDEGEILVLLSGHSLGGALAVLAAYDFACCRRERLVVRCATWGCPRLGDAEFANLCAAAIPDMARYVNKSDPVPCLPPNIEDPNGADSVAMQSFLDRALTLPKKALGAVGFCHVCPGFLLDPESSTTAHLLVSGLEAVVVNAGDATSSFFAPHSLPGYIDSSELARKRLAKNCWSRLPSVGTWLHHHEELEDPFGAFAIPGCSQDQFQEMVNYGLALLQDSEGQSSPFFAFCKQLQPVLEQGPELLESEEGSKLLREVQDKLLCVLPLLTATAQKNKLSGKVVHQLHHCSFGQKLLHIGNKQLLAATTNPDMLKDFVSTLDATRTPGVSFTDSCANVLGMLKHQYLDFVSDEAVREQLLAVGVKVDEHGNMQLQAILDKSEELLDTPLGEQVVKQAQKQALSLISGLEAVSSGTTLSKHSQLLLSQLEETSEGREILAWGREQVVAAKQDPAYLRQLFASAEKDSMTDFGEWCYALLSGDPEGCPALMSSAKDQYLEVLRNPATKQVLQKVGVDVDEHGNIEFAQVLGKSQQLLETAEGAEILKAVQNQILHGVSALEATMDVAGLTETSMACLEKLEITEEGRKLLSWGRDTLREAQEDPDALKKWIGSADASVITDASARDGLIQALSDQFLDFLLAQLPTVEIPTVRKEKDGKLLTLSNIKLGKCTIKKEHVHINLLGGGATNQCSSKGTLPRVEEFLDIGGDSFPPRYSCTEFSSDHVSEARTETLEVSDSASKEEAAELGVDLTKSELGVDLTKSEKEGLAAVVFGDVIQKQDFSSEAVPEEVIASKEQPVERGIDLTKSEKDGFAAVVFGDSKRNEVPKDSCNTCEDENLSQRDSDYAQKTSPRAPSIAPKEQIVALEEIVRLTAREITLDIPDVHWTFQQDSFPYWKDEGVAVARGRGACIILTFGLQRTAQAGKTIPCFALSSQSVVLNDFKLEFKQTKLGWLYNALVNWFSQAVQEYVERSLQDAIASNMEMLLTPLNGRMQPFWPLVLMTAGVPVEKLPEAEASDIVADDVAAPKLAISVRIIHATGLKKLNLTSDNPWCWCGVQDRSGRSGSKRECVSKVVKNTLSPEWNETHLLAPWRRGEGLQFTVYSQGSLGSKVQGSANLPSNWFHPSGFEGSIEISGLGQEGKLFVQVTTNSFEEYSVTLQHFPFTSLPLGLTIDSYTLEVLSTSRGGLVEKCCEEQGVCIQRGDYISAFSVQDGLVVYATCANVKTFLNAMENGSVRQMMWRRRSQE